MRLGRLRSECMRDYLLLLTSKTAIRRNHVGANDEKLMTNFDLTKLPADRPGRRVSLILGGANDRAARTAAFMREEYSSRALLETCQDFIFNDLFDAPRSDFGSLKRIWFFPWFEIQRDCGEALNHVLLTSYKSVYDNCRRALELAVTAAYFLQDRIAEQQAREWVRSKRETPLFTRALAELLKGGRFREVDAASGWAFSIKGFYWRLSDVVHVRGEEASFQKMQPTHLTCSDVAVPEFSETSAQLALDTFIETIRHIATVVAIENPVLLVGLDLDSKFGLNPPLSGFFQDGQASRLRSLILPSAVSALDNLAKHDDDVKSVQAWISGLPDISDEDLKRQCDEQEESWGRGSDQKSESDKS